MSKQKVSESTKRKRSVTRRKTSTNWTSRKKEVDSRLKLLSNPKVPTCPTEKSIIPHEKIKSEGNIWLLSSIVIIVILAGFTFLLFDPSITGAFSTAGFGILLTDETDDLVTFYDEFLDGLTNKTRWYNSTSLTSMHFIEDQIIINTSLANNAGDGSIITTQNLTMHSFNITANVSLQNTSSTFSVDSYTRITVATFDQITLFPETTCSLFLEEASSGAYALYFGNSTTSNPPPTIISSTLSDFGNNLSGLLNMEFKNETNMVNCTFTAGDNSVTIGGVSNDLGHGYGVGIFAELGFQGEGDPSGDLNATVYDFNYSLAPAEVVNTPPTINSIILNTTDVNLNDTEQNVTLYIDGIDSDGDTLRNFTTWILNNSPLMEFYVPFEPSGELNATDYADFDSNGSAVGGSPFWNSTGGHDGGGAWRFPGGSDTILLADGNFPDIGAGNYTLDVWIRLNTTANYKTIFSHNNFDPGFYVHQGSLIVYDGGDITGDTGLGFTDDLWHHAAFVRNSTGTNGLNFYLDGEPAGVATHSASFPAMTDLRVGWSSAGNENFDGHIDELKWWNIPLTLQQIQAIYRNGTNIIVSSETTAGQNWTADVTLNDGTGDSATARSNQLIITDGGGAPAGSGTLSINRTFPYLNSTSRKQNETFNMTYNLSCADDDCSDISVSLEFNPLNNSNFEYGINGWETGGDGEWFATETFPQDSAASTQSGAISDNEITWINQSVYVNQSAQLVFYWNVSSENTFDYLLWCPDAPSCTRTAGYESRISGSTAMAKVTYDLTAGAHQLIWKYAKDSSNPVGADAGWVDNITVFSRVPNGTNASPFKTMVTNIQNKTYSSCLGSLSVDGSCTFAFIINSTGQINESHDLRVSVTSSDSGVDAINTTILNVTINNSAPASPDTTPPLLYVDFPENNTKYGRERVWLNFTVSDETELDQCWFTIFNGSNSTLGGCSNISFTPGRGPFNLTIYANDSSNNLNITGPINFSINSLPSVSNLVLNTTEVTTNDTNQNITPYWTTSDTDGTDTVRNITNWLLNGTSITVLHLPFEGNVNSSTLAVDYSGYGNNGSVRGPVYNSTGFINATPGFGSFVATGALEFDGIDDWVNVSHDNSLSVTDEFTLMMWVRDPVTGYGATNYTTRWVTSQYNSSDCPWTVTTGADDAMRTATLGFEFPFFGQNISGSATVYMDTNGRLSFDDSTSDFNPTTGEMDAEKNIAAIWQDYGGAAQNHEHICTNQGDAPEKWAAFLWNSTFYNNDGTVETELVLFQNGSILSRSGTIAAHTDDWIRGLSNGSDYHYEFKSAILANESQNAFFWDLIYPVEVAAADEPLPERSLINKNYSYTLQMRNMTVWGFINGSTLTNVSVEITKNWTHLAMTFNSTDLTLFKDGKWNDSISITAKVKPNTTDVVIGELINGSIGEVFIFNRSLSAQQINAYYKNKTIIHSEETTTGQNWTVDVTPNDGYEDGTTVRSDQLITLGAAAAGNTVPTIDSIGINSTDVLRNDTSQNVTANVSSSDDDDDDIKLVYNWLHNNSPYAVLNMPFERVNGTSTDNGWDYSGNANNGSVTGATWNSSGGYDGSDSYVFDGINDRIVIPDNVTLRPGTTEWTVAAWIKPPNLDQNGPFIAKRLASGTFNQMQLLVGTIGGGGSVTASKRVSVILREGASGNWWFYTSSDVADGEWHHVAFVRETDESDNALYIDGTAASLTQAKNDGGTIQDIDNTQPWTIGNDNAAVYYNGSIDEILIFNRSLSAQQIAAIYRNETDIIVSQETTPGDNWTVEVTPNDGTEDGSFSRSNQIIINRPPTIDTIGLNSTNLAINGTDQNLTVNVSYTDIDGDKVKLIYNWLVNGSPQHLFNMPFERVNSTLTNNAYDYSTYANTGTVSGAIWNSSGGFDGNGSYDFGKGGVAMVDITLGTHLYLNNSYDEFTTMAWVKTDDNSKTYQWIFTQHSGNTFGEKRVGHGLMFWNNDLLFVISNDTANVNSDTARVNNVITENNTWYHVAGRVNTTNVSVFLNGELQAVVPRARSPHKSGDLNIGGGGVASSQFNGSVDEVLLFNRSLSLEQIQAIFKNQSTVIVSQETRAHENWTVEVIPNDRIADGESAISNQLVIINSPPTTPHLNLTPVNGTSITNRTPTMSWSNSTDDDGNQITYHIQIDDNSAFNNPEVNVSSISTDPGKPNVTYYVDTELDVDVVYYWRVRAEDNTEFGEFTGENNFTVDSLISFSLPTSTIEWGSQAPNQEITTADGTPAPMRGENTGNILLNVSINATQLFNGTALNNSAYQFMIRENLTSSYNLTLSAGNWTNMSKRLHSVVHVVRLNWQNVNDDFLFDLNLTIPSDERAGTKTSIIDFTVEQG